MAIRIIPRLDIKGPNLVKGVNFEGLRVLGKPERFARHYYEAGADELLYVDAVASLYNRNSLLDIVRRTSRELFIPLTVAGGLRSVDDIREALRAGADKVAINTAAVARPELIREASRAFGSSTIIVAIEAAPAGGGRYEVCTCYGRERTGLDAFAWALQAVELGAGELLVTSVAKEGMGKGLDLALTRVIAEAVPVPVIAGGGAGSPDHLAEAVVEGRADAVALASMLHYNAVRGFMADEQDYAAEGNIEFLRRSQAIDNRARWDLAGLKESLAKRGLGIRIATGGS
jgi:cyclase